MKFLIVLLVLLTLTIYSSGRTRFRLFEFDPNVAKAGAYKHCMNKLKLECANAGVNCEYNPDDPVFQAQNMNKCQHYLGQESQAEDPKENPDFKPYEIWQLFEK